MHWTMPSYLKILGQKFANNTHFFFKAPISIRKKERYKYPFFSSLFSEDSTSLIHYPRLPYLKTMGHLFAVQFFSYHIDCEKEYS